MRVAFLAKDCCSETPRIAECETKVGAALFLDFLLIFLGCDTFHEGDGVVRLKDLRVEGAQAAVNSQYGGPANDKVDIRSAHLDAGFKQSIDMK